MRLVSSLTIPLALLLPLGCSSPGDGVKEDTSDSAGCEVCDGVDNDGDGLVDEDYADVDRDGIADCVDEDSEVCDGIDNDGDGSVDEGFGDADADGIADCSDPEDCDGVDNNGDGNVDEGFDGDGNGIADCLDELCNCEDDDGDGTVDEGLDCSYEVTLNASADDVMSVYLDGIAVGNGSGWSNLFSQTYTLPGGVHHLAVDAGDTGGVIAGFNARVTVPGAGATDFDTGLGVWRVTTSNPATVYGMAWTTGAAVLAMPADDAYVASNCDSIWGSSPSGAPWVWAEDCSRWSEYRKNWFYLEVDVCPAAAESEECDGIDNDGDGEIDEGYVDSDFDGEADCIEVEVCDGLDNDGDTEVDEGYADTDMDGIADCSDPEDCDGLDNDGDGSVDEGFSDTDGDGTADCVDEETCDGVDNDGDGSVDEGYPDTDRDGIADCEDREECDGLDNDGDGSVDEGFTDTDGDGTADCVDEETCDGLDNNGNGSVDEGYADTDGDGTADCIEPEDCDCVDNDGDGRVDEDGTCSYDVTLKVSADDYWQAFYDGVSWGSGSSWSTLGTLTTTTTAGDHAIAVYAYDGFGISAGMNARVEVTGEAVDAWDTGLGLWVVSATNPSTYGASSTWKTTPYTGMERDSLYPATSGCLSRWGSGYRPSGGAWVWRASCSSTSTYPANWFLLEFEVCPAALE